MRRTNSLRFEALEPRAVPAGLPFAGGNLIVTQGHVGAHFFREYTPDGTLVRQVRVPVVDGDYTRDVAVTQAGQLVVFNGTFDPSLSVYDPVAETWTHRTFPGWGTVNVGSAGGVTVHGTYAYATDSSTGNGGDASGIVRFNLADGSARRFADGTDYYEDVYYGPDGFLYALNGVFGEIDVFDPTTLTVVRTVRPRTPGSDFRALAVNAAGELYLGVWNHEVYHVAADGTLLDTLDMNALPPAGQVGGTWSLDVSADGTEVLLVAGSGYLVRTDADLSNPRVFNPQLLNARSFGAYVRLPGADAGPDRTINEGDFVQFRTTRSAGPAPVTYTWDFGDGTQATGLVPPRHRYPDSGTFTVTLTVRDGAGRVATDTAVVTSRNVAPTGRISGPTQTVPGWYRPILIRGSDPSNEDRIRLSYRIDWGDGTWEVMPSPGAATIPGHVYALPGTYTIRVVVTDRDGAASPEVRWPMTVRPVVAAAGALYVGGTPGDDVIVVRAAGTGVDVAVNGTVVAAGAPALVGVFAGAGDDTVATVGPVRARLLAQGGLGADRLDARSMIGPAVLAGGPGADRLIGGAGRDILLGGWDTDVLDGGANQDVLFGDATGNETDPANMLKLSREWARTGVSYETRRARLAGEVEAGLNRPAVLASYTTAPDQSIDVRTGGTGRDWFLGVVDTIQDAAADEVVTAL